MKPLPRTNHSEDLSLLSRRTVLKSAAAAGATLAVSDLLSACGSESDSDVEVPRSNAPFPLPLQLEGELSGNLRTFKLSMQKGTMEWIAGRPTDTFGINGNYLGPTLRFNRGERVRLEVHNGLGEISTLHWHGIQLPAQSDGGPYQTIDPGATWVTEYDIVQRALMAWYHPHHMHETGRQVYMGMAGLIYIDDKSQEVELPSEYGVNDIPLVIQDRRFNSDGTHVYSTGDISSQNDRMAGVKGKTILVNGAVGPELRVLKGLTRFRILNGSNARNYNLGFSDNRAFQYIGNEGGLFENAIDSTRVLLSPGERADILVDFTGAASTTSIRLQSYSGEVHAELFSGRMGSNLSDAYDQSTFDIMTLQVAEDVGQVISPPKEFAAITPMLETAAVRTRTLELSMARGDVFINGAQMLDTTSVSQAISFNIPAGDTEIWTLTNSSGMAHPVHIHHRHFQILDIDGAQPPAYLRGWKDTVLVRPNQVIRVLLKFEGTTDPNFPYMFHCHILEHEDAGMMGQFYIV